MESVDPSPIRIGSRAALASWVPFGLDRPGPRRGPGLARAAWRARHHPRFALDVLRYGVCGTCELGTHGLRDDAIAGVHFCSRRLDDLPRYLAEAFDPHQLPEVAGLRKRTAEQLRSLGRIPVPLVWRAGQSHFTPVGWPDALHLAATRIREAKRPWAALADPGALSNEGFFCLQSVARTLGTPHIDLTGDAGHRVALSLLQWTGGLEAATCSLVDLCSTDLVVLWGLGLRRHPFLARLLHLGRAAGARVIAIGPAAEPEFEGVYLGAGPGAAVFGSRLVDEHISIAAGGDRHLAWGLLKALSEQRDTDDAFFALLCTGAERLPRRLEALEWETITAGCGLSRERVRHLARTFGAARTGVLALGAALGRGPDPGQTVGAVLSVALARGWFARDGGGVLPLGGEAGVRGARDVGFGPELGEHGGWKTGEILDQATRGGLDLLWMAGEGLADALPRGPSDLSRLPVRVHQSMFLDPAMMLEPGEAVLVLPTQSRYEARGGSTFTSVDRHVRFSPEILGHPVGEARPDWQIACQVACAADPALKARFDPVDAAAVREVMARDVAGYDRVDRLHAPGDGFQWGGRRLHADAFATDDGRARLPPIDPPRWPNPGLRLATRRTGDDRRTVGVSAATAAQRGLEEGAPVRVRSDWGELNGVIRIAPVHDDTVQTYWPEGRVLQPPADDARAAGAPLTVSLETTS